jgi:hypothetical protein
MEVIEDLEVLCNIIDLDSGNIESIRSLTNFICGPVTIGFQSFEKDFGLVGENDLNDAPQEIALVLIKLIQELHAIPEFNAIRHLCLAFRSFPNHL